MPPHSAQSSRATPRWCWILYTAAVFALAGASGPLLVEHARNVARGELFNEDVRQQIPPFFRYAEPVLAEKDYLGDYYLANYPLGFRGIYTVAGRFDGAVTLSEWLPYLLIAMTILFIAIAAMRLGGVVAACASIALCLGSSLYLAQSAGGLPRAFAFPLLAAFVAAATCGRIRLAWIVVAISALFYPVTALCAGVAFAIIVLLFPASARGEVAEWPLRRRLWSVLMLAGTGFLLIAPVQFSARNYGPLLSPYDVVEYPEAGPSGRYSPAIAPPHPSFIETTPEVLKGVIFGAGQPWFETTRAWATSIGDGTAWIGVVLLIALLGGFRLARRDPAALRFAALLPAAIASYEVARFLAPRLYVPLRYSVYPVALLATVGIPAAFAGFARQSQDRSVGFPYRCLAIGLGWLLLLLPVAGRGDPLAGLLRRPVEQGGIYAAIAALPPDSLIAGWPRGLMDNVPLLTRRAVLLNYESHQAFHREFVRKLRVRMNAVIAAYYATDPQPLVHLRETFGVTHFLVERRVLNDKRLSYFAPFDATIREARKRISHEPREVLRQAESAAVFRTGELALIDLSSLATHHVEDSCVAGEGDRSISGSHSIP